MSKNSCVNFLLCIRCNKAAVLRLIADYYFIESAYNEFTFVDTPLYDGMKKTQYFRYVFAYSKKIIPVIRGLQITLSFSSNSLASLFSCCNFQTIFFVCVKYYVNSIKFGYIYIYPQYNLWTF